MTPFPPRALAAALGLPYAFASHFAPGQMMEAVALYRRKFRPSPQLDEPYVMLGFNIFAADTDQEAERLITSLQQQFVNLRRGQPGPLNPPLEFTAGLWTDQERHGVEHALRESIVGSQERVQSGIASFIRKTGVDELMVTGHIFDHTARLRSFEIVAQVAMSRTPVVNAKSY